MHAYYLSCHIRHGNIGGSHHGGNRRFLEAIQLATFEMASCKPFSAPLLGTNRGHNVSLKAPNQFSRRSFVYIAWRCGIVECNSSYKMDSIGRIWSFVIENVIGPSINGWNLTKRVWPWFLADLHLPPCKTKMGAFKCLGSAMMPHSWLRLRILAWFLTQHANMRANLINADKNMVKGETVLWNKKQTAASLLGRKLITVTRWESKEWRGPSFTCCAAE